jgi:hypothetical protein
MIQLIVRILLMALGVDRSMVDTLGEVVFFLWRTIG